MSTPIRKIANIIAIVLALAAVAHSRPGETSSKIQQRFGEPLKEREPVTKDSGSGGIKVHLPPGTTARHIGDAKNHEPPRMRYVGKPHFTPSMRETAFVYKLGKMGITVHFFDDRSQREEYAGGFKSEDVDKILTAASNGEKWEIELNAKDSTDYTTERVYDFDGKFASGHYKTVGGRAWIDPRGKVIVETDGFRALRLAQEATKPQPGVGQPIPGKGTGL